MCASVFSEIIDGNLPAFIVGQDERIIVFISLENHPLIVPKKHLRDIFEMDAETGAAVMAWSVRVAKAMRDALECDGIYVTQANDAAAGQDVFHYHMHLYPKWNDGRVMPIDDAARETMANRLATALRPGANLEKL